MFSHSLKKNCWVTDLKYLSGEVFVSNNPFLSSFNIFFLMLHQTLFLIYLNFCKTISLWVYSCCWILLKLFHVKATRIWRLSLLFVVDTDAETTPRNHGSVTHNYQWHCNQPFLSTFNEAKTRTKHMFMLFQLTQEENNTKTLFSDIFFLFNSVFFNLFKVVNYSFHLFKKKHLLYKCSDSFKLFVWTFYI